MTLRTTAPNARKTAPTPSKALKSAGADFDFTRLVGHLLRRAYQRHAAIFQQAINDFQLTAAQFAVLCAVRERGASSQSEIVKITAIDQATLRGIIDRLRARGLITVTHDPDDRRKVIVGMTASGSAAVEQTIPVVEQISELTFGTLNPAERIALVYVLQKMVQFDDLGPATEVA